MTAETFAVPTTPETGDRAAGHDADGWSLHYDGAAGGLLWLAFKVGLLTVLTVGIYRFWAKTRIRRYLWGAIHFGGSALEYHGRGTELLIGFLIAIAVLAPLSFAYSAMTQYLLTPDSPGAALAQLLWVVVVLLLYGAAIFRMTRYRLSRTSWRGIRFGLDGSTIAFARLFLGYALLTAVTLGIAYPWLRKAIVGYRLNHARFGRTPFTFEASAGPLLGSWLLFLATLVAAVIVLIAAAERTTGEGTSLQATVDFADFAVLAIPLFAISPVLFIRYRVQEFRLFVASSRLGRAGFASDARATPIVIAAVLTLFAIGLALLALGAMAAAVVTTLPAASGEVDPGALSPMAKILGLIALFFAVFALIPALNYGIFVHSLVRHGCRSMVVHDPAAFEAAARSAVPGPQYGEGIADAFDIGGI